MRNDLADIKAAIPLSSLFARDGVDLSDAGNGEKIGRCPIHEDDTPSLYVNDRKGTFFCHGCGSGGDHISYLEAAHGLKFHEAVALLRGLAGPDARDIVRRSAPIRPAEPGIPKPVDLPVLVPDLSPGSTREHWTLAKLRGLSVIAIEAASDLGLLRFGSWMGRRAWFVTDSMARVAQARRLDGQKWRWRANGRPCSSKTFRLPCDRENKAGSWLVGVETAVKKSRIEIAEGEGDLLAAIDLAIQERRFGRTGFACLLGAGNRIHPQAVRLLAGKDVLLRAQNDERGLAGAARWREQLRGAKVEAWHPPSAGADLNDYVRSLRGWRPVASRRCPLATRRLSPALDGR